jgi:hypothetical protein
MHLHTIEEHINLKRLTGLIILDQPLSLGSRSGQHLGTGMATFLCVRAQANRKEATPMEFMDLFFYCMQFLVFYFGEAIQWTTDYPQGHTTDGTGERETWVFALARYLLYSF